MRRFADAKYTRPQSKGAGRGNKVNNQENAKVFSIVTTHCHSYWDTIFALASFVEKKGDKREFPPISQKGSVGAQKKVMTRRSVAVS